MIVDLTILPSQASETNPCPPRYPQHHTDQTPHWRACPAFLPHQPFEMYTKPAWEQVPALYSTLAQQLQSEQSESPPKLVSSEE